MRFGRLIYFLALLICVLEIVRLWSITPPEMAAHFNAQGIPDRFVAKTEFFWFQVQTLAVVVGVSLLPQMLILLLPASLINMPHREYWLAPERRDETLNRLSSFGAVMFAVILLAVQAAFELAAYANLQTPIRYNAQWMFLFMIGSIILIGLALLQLAVSFRLPND